MPTRALLCLIAAGMLAGCTQPQPLGAPRSARVLAAAGIDAELARFTREEGRKVAARHVPMNEGRGAAELHVPLSPEEQALLVRLYRLHPRAVQPAQFPSGLIARTAAHLATLHAFKKPGAVELDRQKLASELRTRVYRDGDGTVLAFESFHAGDDFMLFGKYDLQGRILKIDVETWTQ